MHKYVNICIKYAYICIHIHEIRINIHKSAIFEYQTSQGPCDKPTRQDCTVTLTYIYIYIYLCIFHIYICIYACVCIFNVDVYICMHISSLHKGSHNPPPLWGLWSLEICINILFYVNICTKYAYICINIDEICIHIYIYIYVKVTVQACPVGLSDGTDSTRQP